MTITADQIYALDCIAKIEELYLNELSTGDTEEMRVKNEPLRSCIEYLKQQHNITAEVRNDYHTYVQAIRDAHIYSDKLRQLKNNLDSHG